MIDSHLGEFEELILIAVLGLEDTESYAVPIQQHLSGKTGRHVTPGSVYRSLSRLENKGFLQSAMGEVTRAKGGKRKRFYSVTETGKEAVYAAREAREKLWKHVQQAASALTLSPETKQREAGS